MQLIKQIVIKIYQLGFFDAVKLFIKKINDKFTINYLTINLVKKSHKINSPLILITQIQRSGGTLLSQLFDNHKQIYAYPNELTIWKPKWEFKTLEKKFSKLDNNYINYFALNSEYKKESKSKWNKSYKFYFDLMAQKKIYSQNILKNSSQRSILNAYFTSFFSSWINYRNILNNKKYITAFIPRVNTSSQSLKYFFKNYPDGKIITIVRDPLDWLASAKNHNPTSYSDFSYALNLWKKSTNASMRLIKKNQAIGITFFDLVKNTKKTMNYICKVIKIPIEDTIYVPTFNGEPILSDSSFKSVEGVIDKKTLNRKKNSFSKLEKKELKKLFTLQLECKKLYSSFKKIKSN